MVDRQSKNQPDSTHILDSSINDNQLVPILQSFHVERQRSKPTVSGESRDDTSSIDTLEHCRYFTTHGLANSPDKKGSLRLHVLWDTGASHNFISRRWLNRYEQLFGTCPVVNQNVRYRIADSPDERTMYAVCLNINLGNGIRTSVCCSVVPAAPTYDLLLGKLWMHQHRIILDTYHNFATGWFKGKKIGIHGDHASRQQHPASNIIHNIEEIKTQLKECKQEGLVPMFVQRHLLSNTTKEVKRNESKDSDAPADN